MKILIACDLPRSALDALRDLGCVVACAPVANGAVTAETLSDVNVLVVGEARVSSECIQAGPNLQLIVHAGPGAAEIAVDEAANLGIFVAHCPDQDAYAIAELALGLLLALDRQIVDNTITLRAGRWTRSEFLGGLGLAGRMLGILGFDAAARALASRARACEMLVAAWSPTLTPEQAAAADVEYCDWPRDVARLADAVVVLPIGDAATEQHVDSEFVHTLPDGASLVHLGHPGAVDESALADAVKRRGLRVAVDTHASVPVGDSNRFRSRLLQLPGVIGTHHVRAATAQAQEAIAREVVAIVRAFLLTGRPPHALNVAERTPARWQLLLRVRDEVGVMASILDAIRADGINAEEISSHVFTGARAASCTISLGERPSAETLEAIRALPVVLHLDVRAVV